MRCPKCKAKIGVMRHEVILDSGVVHCVRCVLCGYWSQPLRTTASHTITLRSAS